MLGGTSTPPLAKAHGGRSTAAGMRAIMHRPRSLGQTRDRVTPRKETVEDKRRAPPRAPSRARETVVAAA